MNYYEFGRQVAMTKMAKLPDWYGSETTAYAPPGKDLGIDSEALAAAKPEALDALAKLKLPSGAFHSIPITKKPRGFLGRLFKGRSITPDEVDFLKQELGDNPALDVTGPDEKGEAFQFSHPGELTDNLRDQIEQAIENVMYRRKLKSKIRRHAKFMATPHGFWGLTEMGRRARRIVEDDWIDALTKDVGKHPDPGYGLDESEKRMDAALNLAMRDKKRKDETKLLNWSRGKVVGTFNELADNAKHLADDGYGNMVLQDPKLGIVVLDHETKQLHNYPEYGEAIKKYPGAWDTSALDKNLVKTLRGYGWEG